MATRKQIEANRLNARRSTGPRTREGKARVGANALRHGLTAKRVLLAIEDPAEFEAFRESIIEAYDPCDAVEAMLVDRIVEHAWRLRRVPAFEAGLYNRRFYKESMALAGYKSSRRGEVALKRLIAGTRRPLLGEEQQTPSAEAQASILAAQEKMNEPIPRMALGLDGDAAAFTNLWRHEAALMRSLQRCMHELERRQDRRAGEPVAVPALVDIDLNPKSDGGGEAAA